jgi:hypothetical protein
MSRAADVQFTGSYPGLLPQILPVLSPSYRSSDAFLSRLCRIAIHDSNLEQLVLILNEMWDRGSKPSITIITHGIRLACENGLPRLAIGLAQEFDKDHESGTKVPSASWVRILMSSAENSFVSHQNSFMADDQLEGVELAWDHTVVSRHYTPDEGLLSNVLNVAARSGRPELVTRVLDVLPVLSVQPQEYHLVALMEAYVKAGQVPQALQVLSMIRSVGLLPTRHTAQPILDVLTTPELVDQAFFALEDVKAQGQSIDITAFNVLIEASSRLEDVQRVRATQLAASDLGVVPDIDTFNSALAVCIPASHRALADTILEEMKQHGISPNGWTYHNMILTCLTQPKYDDAFFYLETSKSEGYKPLVEAYRKLALRCSSANDARSKMVIDEMESLGYKMEFPRDKERTDRDSERGGRRDFGKSGGNIGRREFGARREGGAAGNTSRQPGTGSQRYGSRRDGASRGESSARREVGQHAEGGQPREAGQRREGGPRREGSQSSVGGERRSRPSTTRSTIESVVRPRVVE